MKKAPHMLAAACAAALPAPASAAQGSGWKNLVGLPSPGFSAEEWLNVDEAPTPEALQGKVYLLEFFATT